MSSVLGEVHRAGARLGDGPQDAVTTVDDHDGGFQHVPCPPLSHRYPGVGARPTFTIRATRLHYACRCASRSGHACELTAAGVRAARDRSLYAPVRWSVGALCRCGASARARRGRRCGRTRLLRGSWRPRPGRRAARRWSADHRRQGFGPLVTTGAAIAGPLSTRAWMRVRRSTRRCSRSLTRSFWLSSRCRLAIVALRFVLIGPPRKCESRAEHAGALAATSRIPKLLPEDDPHDPGSGRR